MIIAESGTAWADEDRWQRLVNLHAHISAAVHARADYFKVQMFAPEEPLFCPLPGDEVRWERWNNSLLEYYEWLMIKSRCTKLGIGFMASAFQPTAVQWLNKLGVDYHKVASRAAGSYPVENVKDKIILSDGMKLWDGRHFDKQLQCVSKYPASLKKSKWDRWYDGLSDHSGTPWPAIDALARGAEIVEVHFKIRDDGPDADSSVTVKELKMICDFQRALKEMRG